MQYRSTRQLVDDLAHHGRLIVVSDEVDPYLELAEIHRRVYRNGGPALLFNRVRGTQFSVTTNLFGTLDRARFVFRDHFDSVRRAVSWKADFSKALRKPWQLWKAPLIAARMRARAVRRASVMSQECCLSDLPKIVCWPDDGGPFVTLPQVLSQMPQQSAFSAMNLGMYRVQLAGNDYARDVECGLHYQIHRGIGVHHARAIELGQPLPVSINVGGTPAMTIGAIMPLPEGMSELMFAGALAGHRIPIHRTSSFAPLYADADFCITGHIDPDNLKPEGPFGDHLGYYARVHPFPVLNVKKVFHRADAVWPATVVGRPPQEDTTFGQLIHELTAPVIPTVLPGVREVHAVDAAGVHPLLLAVGSERYTPYQKPNRPQELLTQACAILGQGQLSLAKYLWIIDGTEGAPSARDVGRFLEYALRRVDWRRDLHFHTCTTMDTLDYSGHGLNQGSKLVIAAAGEPIRDLPVDVPSHLPEEWSLPCVAAPGILVVEGASYTDPHCVIELQQSCDRLAQDHSINQFPLLVIADDSDFAARSLDNFLWTTFTRSNPATDVYGIAAFTSNKHFGCAGSLIIDARSKPHHAPPLVEDTKVTAKVDARAAHGDELAKYL